MALFTWKLGTSSTAASNADIPGLYSATQFYESVGATIETWDGTLHEDMVAVRMGWAFRCRLLTAAQRSALEVLRRENGTLYLRDERNAGNLAVRFVGPLDIEVVPVGTEDPAESGRYFRYNVEFKLRYVTPTTVL
jgi:hypothetical protein